jgi:peptide/nickel transport system substrate-binding protein
MGVGRRAVVAIAAALGLMLSTSAYAYTEAPSLAQQVRENKLPPVDQRVGTEPEAVKPLQAVGSYGGQLRFGLRGSSDYNHILRIVGPQGLVRWDPLYTKVVPNVARQVDVSPDSKVFTFHLRKGMKWSDGKPFTADDVLFNMNDIVIPGAITPIQPRYMTGDKPVKVEKIDDLTVRMTFTESYGDFLAELASPLGQNPVLYAKHYCSQFMPKFNAKVDDLVKEARVGDWQALFLAKCGDLETASRWGNPAKPTLDPWVMKEPYVGGATRIVMERNPYFWQVDTAGNQLPYIDQVIAPIAQDVESLVLEAIAGRIDYQVRHFESPSNRAVLAANRAKGGYEFTEARSVGGNNMTINLNLTHKDPELRALFNIKDFRVALSLGIDRKEVIDTALLGEGEPWQQGPFEDHPNFHKKLSTQFIQYDVATANKMLDGVGLDKRGSNGMRLMKSGKPLRFKIDVITVNPFQVDMLQVVKRQWAKIGIDMDVNVLERTLFYERTSESNNHDAAVWEAGNNFVAGDIPQQMVPVHHDSRWGIPWSVWYKTGGKQGEEPPASIKQRMTLWDQARATADEVKRRDIMMKIADLASEEFEVIGITKRASTYGVRKANLKNVPEAIPSSWYYPTPAPALPQEWYWAR